MKKSDLLLPNKWEEAPIVEGSRVVCIDGSYTVAIRNGGYEIDNAYYPGLSEEVWVVVAVNVTCPTTKGHTGSLTHLNNCIIKAPNGDIVFCSQINIRNIKYLGDTEPYRLNYLAINN